MKKIVKGIVAVLIATSVMGLAAGCQKTQPQPKVEEKKPAAAFPVTITDVYGTSVTIDKKPEKIVALAPSTVEVLYKLGVQDSIVGVTEYCDFPVEAKDKPKVGDFNGVNLEKIIELKPDVVLAGAGLPQEAFQKLTSLNIKVAVVEAKELKQVPETFIMMGKITGTEDKANALVNEYKTKMDSIVQKAKDAAKVKTYYVISYGEAGNWTAGKGTFISDLVNMAGGENVTDDVEGWKEYSTEKIIEKNPDVLLLSSMVVTADKDALSKEKGYKETNAVKNGKVIVVKDDLTTRPGPRLADGLEIIAKAIHPELFK